MFKIFRSPLFCFLLLLLVINLGFFLINPYTRVPDAQHSVRNVFPKRAWPEYTSARKQHGKKLVIVIGNSQSYGEEWENPDSIYPAYLQQMLGRDNVVLENWSLRGIRTADLEILTTKALLKGADLIVLPIDMSNFDLPENINLSFPNTDVNLLLASPAMWEPIKHSLVVNSFEDETVLRRSVNYYVPMVRYRAPLYKQVAKHITREKEIFFFGNPVSRELNPQIKDAKTMRKRLMHKDNNNNNNNKRNDFWLTHNDYLNALQVGTLFNRYLAQRKGSLPTRILYVWQPLKTGILHKQDMYLENKFREAMKSELDALGFARADMLTAIPDSMFQYVSHFNPGGHKLFARKMYSLIKNELQ